MRDGVNLPKQGLKPYTRLERVLDSSHSCLFLYYSPLRDFIFPHSQGDVEGWKSVFWNFFKVEIGLSCLPFGNKGCWIGGLVFTTVWAVSSARLFPSSTSESRFWRSLQWMTAMSQGPFTASKSCKILALCSIGALFAVRRPHFSKWQYVHGVL